MLNQWSSYAVPSQELVYPICLERQTKPILNKVIARNGSIFCGYSNGQVLMYSSKDGNPFELSNEFQPYQNVDVIDMQTFDGSCLAMCTHSEVTLYNMVKNKSISLKGHESTPLAVSCHPVSPLVVSVSNLIIEHDVRMRAPINVNFITPPVFDIQYFPDGQFFLLSGEPCRIGRDSWTRTLLNGMAKCSLTSKHVLSNDMNGSITLWDWRQSAIKCSLKNINNHQTYQPIHFGLKQGSIESILFLEDDGTLLHHSFKEMSTRRKKLFDVSPEENWKMEVNEVSFTTDSLLVYEHLKTVIKVYKHFD